MLFPGRRKHVRQQPALHLWPARHADDAGAGRCVLRARGWRANRADAVGLLGVHARDPHGLRRGRSPSGDGFGLRTDTRVLRSHRQTLRRHHDLLFKPTRGREASRTSSVRKPRPYSSKAPARSPSRSRTCRRSLKAAHAKGIAVILDNTWATPLYFDAMGHGVDLSVQSATKYVGGHADVLLGAVTANAAYKDRLVSAWRSRALLVGRRCVPHAARAAHAVRALEAPPGKRDRARDLAEEPSGGGAGDLPAAARRSGPCAVEARFHGACGLFSVVLRRASDKAVAAMLDGMTHLRPRLFLGRVREPDPDRALPSILPEETRRADHPAAYRPRKRR